MAESPSEELLQKAEKYNMQWDPSQDGFVPIESTSQVDVVEQPEPVEQPAVEDGMANMQPDLSPLQPEPQLDPAPIDRGLLEKAAGYGMKYDANADGFVPFNEVEITEIDGGGFIDESVGYLEGIRDGASPETMAKAARYGLKYDGLRKAFVEDRISLLTPEEHKEMKEVRDARPGKETLQKMVFFANSGLELDYANPGYFETNKGDWQDTELTPQKIDMAIRQVELDLRQADAEIAAIAKRDKGLSMGERFMESAFEGTAIDPSDPDILKTRAGLSMRNAMGRSLSGQLVLGALRKAKTDGFSEYGELTFEDLRKGYSNLDQDVLADMTIEEFVSGAADGAFKQATERSWAELLNISEAEPGAMDYMKGVLGVPFRGAKNVPKQMFEYGAIIPVVAKSVAYDPVVGAIKDLAREVTSEDNFGSMVGSVAYDLFEGDPYKGAEVKPAFMSEMDREGNLPSSIEGMDVESALSMPVKKVISPAESSQFLKEIGDVIMGGGQIASGLVGALGDLGQTGYEVATFNEDGYKKVVNFLQERPLDAAALGAIPIAGARAATAGFLNSARAAAAESNAAFQRAYVRQAGRPVAKATPAEQYVAQGEAVAMAGVGSETSTLKSIGMLFSTRGVTKETVRQAMDLMPSIPKGSELYKLHAKRVADEVAVKALEGRYKVQTQRIKYLDPAGHLLSMPFKVASMALPASASNKLRQSLKRRDVLLSEIRIQTASMSEPKSLFDILSDVSVEKAERVVQNDRLGNAAPEQILREVDDMLRQVNLGEDAWIILPDGQQVKLGATLKEPELETIFGRKLEDSEKEMMVERPEVIHQEIRRRGSEAVANLEKTVKERLNAVSELGLLPDEQAHLHSLLDFTAVLQRLQDLPETYQGMRASEKSALKSSFSKRRALAKKRKDAKDRLLSFIQNPKNLTQEDRILLEQAYKELSDVSHEWGNRRSPDLIVEAIDDFDSVSGVVNELVEKMSDGKRKDATKRLVKDIRSSDKGILDIDQYSIDILDRYYRSELLNTSDAALFGSSGERLRALSDEVPMTAEQRAALEQSIEQYEQGIAEFKKAEDARRTKRIKKKERKRQTPILKQKVREVEEQLAVGRKEADAQYEAFSKEVREELANVRAEIIDSIRLLDNRASKVHTIKNMRFEKAQAIRTLEEAKATGGGGGLVAPAMMLKAGMTPQAVPAKHISLAQALALTDNLDDNLTALQAQAFADNGIDINAAKRLGPDVMNYMRFIQENYFDQGVMADALAVYSEKPLNMLEPIKIQQLKDYAQRPLPDKLRVLSDMADAGLDMPQGGTLRAWKRYMDQGIEPPEKIRRVVEPMIKTAASDIRTQVFRTSMEAISAGLLDPDIARLRIATYFPDLYSKYEDAMRLSVDDAVELSLGDDFRPIIDRNLRRFSVEGNNFKYSKYKLLSLEEKRAMGLIDDPAAVFVVGMNRIQNDIIVSKMFKELSEATIQDGPFKGSRLAMTADQMKQTFGDNWESMAGEGLGKEWRKIPGKEIVTFDPSTGIIDILTGKKRLSQNYGELGGLYVPTSLFDDIVKVPQLAGRVATLYSKFLSNWKVGKTALNPATQLRNHVSNWFVADMNGMLQSSTAWRVMKDDDIARQAWTHSGDLVEEAITSGLFGNSLIDIETQGALGKRMGAPPNLKTVLRKIERDKLSGTEASVMMTDVFVGESWMKKGVKALFGPAIATRSYQFGDEFYKLWRYGQIRGLQKEFLKSNNLSKEMIRAFGGQEEALAVLNIADARAAKRAAVQRVFEDGFLDYSRVSSAVNWMRKGWSPFIVFSAEMLPKFIARMRQHPVKALLYRESFIALNNYSEQLDGTASLQELEDISTEEAMLPPYMRGKSMYAGKRMIETEEGTYSERQFYDVTNYHVTGQMYRPTEADDSPTFSQDIAANWPFYGELLAPREALGMPLARALLNRHEFADDSGALYRTDAGRLEKAKAQLGLLWNNYAPGYMGRPASKLYSAATQTPYGGRGKMLGPMEALEDAFLGIRTTSRPEGQGLEAGLDYKRRMAETPQTPQDRRDKNLRPDEWNQRVEEKFDKVDEYYETRRRRREKALKEQFNRMSRLRRGQDMLRSLVE